MWSNKFSRSFFHGYIVSNWKWSSQKRFSAQISESINSRFPDIIGTSYKTRNRCPCCHVKIVWIMGWKPYAPSKLLGNIFTTSSHDPRKTFYPKGLGIFQYLLIFCRSCMLFVVLLHLQSMHRKSNKRVVFSIWVG